ncbi:oxidoreductase nitrogenase component 1 [Spirochaetia bacterium]|nr:oxidoreductase nitrogenase component 1 [Spirochaetia bacterium]
MGIEKSRLGCNLHGALQTVTQIGGVVPIVHSTSGCAIQQYYAARAGGTLSPYRSGFEVPASNIYEKQIIFGGASRLREQMKNAVKVFEGDLYIVLSGCESEMVGDDVVAMTEELTDQGVPIICYEAAGFKGSVYSGYEGLVDAILTQLPKVTAISAGTEEDLVNILGIIPGQEPCWQGNLAEIRRILRGLGLRVNTLFGSGQRVENWKQACRAKLNIVLSQWGVKAAQRLKDQYGIPCVEVNGGFLGEAESSRWIQKIAALIPLNKEKQESFLAEEKGRFVHAIGQIKEYYYAYRFQKKFIIVGDEGTILRYGTFLTGVLGLSLLAAVVTDARDSKDPIVPSEALTNLGGKIYFSRDSGEIASIVSALKPDLLLGSALERETAERLGIPELIVSYPSDRAVILNRCDLGYTGALTVLEDISNLIIDGEHGDAKI